MSGRVRLALLAVTLALACSERQARPPAGSEPVSGGTAVILGSSDLDHANPLATTQRYTQELLRYALFMPLLARDEMLSLQPALAREWTIDADTAVTFHLREDVRWHDGAPTTAWDVAFTFERALDPRTAFANADWLDGWGAPQVIDSFTIRFALSRPDPLANIPDLPIAPRHLLESIPPEQMRQASFNRAPVGNGPFRFVETTPNDRWIFEANADFPQELGGRPHLDRLIWRVVPEGTSQIVELTTGNADLATGASIDQAVAAVRDADLRLISRPSRQYAFIGWNGRRAPLDDARVRRAFAYALNRQEMVDALRSGHGIVANGPVGDWHWAFDPTLPAIPFAPDSARALLDQVGIVDRDGDGIRERADGSGLTLVLKVAASGFNRDLGAMVLADLAEIGIRMELRPIESNTLIADVTSAERNFDAFLFGWVSDFRLDLRGVFHSAERDGMFQFASYRNPEVDSLIDRIGVERDQHAARDAFMRLQSILRQDQPWGFLYFYSDVYVVSPRLQGVEMDIRGALVNVARWWVAADAQRGAATK